MPASHETGEKLPAVSGSAGRLVIEASAEQASASPWPGQVFADESRDDTEAMLAFVAASRQPAPAAACAAQNTQEQTRKAQKRALRQPEEALPTERRTERQQRTREDAAWQALQDERQAPASAGEEPPAAEGKAQQEQGRLLRRQRRERLARRKEADQAWKQKRLALRQQGSALPIVTAWIAILVIPDTCTRQCVGLPLFVAGPKVTAEMSVQALRVLLPPELLFVISDRGVPLRADALQTLMRQEEFIHVLSARHRPQSNGMAERFVRSLKEWLRDKSWQDDQELAALLDAFLAESNDRPHQGLPIPGLSPNEFANRIWLF